MEVLNDIEITNIAELCGYNTVTNWILEDFSDKIIGYLGEHLKLTIRVRTEEKNNERHINFFVKSMPRFDKWKVQYLKESTFFDKEYVMLSKLFPEFDKIKGSKKWRPRAFLVRPDVFVFENLIPMGYSNPSESGMSLETLIATVKTLARFHALSYIYEETKSRELGKRYRIWDSYGDYLKLPDHELEWRDIGKNAVIDFLKVYSKYKNERNFVDNIERVIPLIFKNSVKLTLPGEYRNAVVHRDLWANNIFVKGDKAIDVLFVDFQTVVYCSPMTDLAVFLYINTVKAERDAFTSKLIDIYYNNLSKELYKVGIDVKNIIDYATLEKSYEESVMFAITHAAIVVPIVTMRSDCIKNIYDDPEGYKKAKLVSRSEGFLQAAKVDMEYRERVIELFDEIVEKYIYNNNIIANTDELKDKVAADSICNKKIEDSGLLKEN